MSPETENKTKKTGWGAENVGIVGIISITTYFIILSIFLFSTLASFWPSMGVNASKSAETIIYFGISFKIYAEVRMLILVFLAGAIGSLIHTIRSFSWYTGQRELVWSWVIRYILQPFIGSALGLVFYFVIRGGFFSPTAGVQETSAYSFVAMAGLVGLFAESAIVKLKQVADTLFAKPETGEDSTSNLREAEEKKDNNKK